MLTRDQRVYLIKKVDCHAMSSARKDALPDYFRAFPTMPSEEDVRQIADILYLGESTVRKIAEETLG
jgi:hypothetical protein